MGTKLLWSIRPIPRSVMILVSTGSSTLCTSTGSAEDSQVPEGRPAVCERVVTAPTISRVEVPVPLGSTGTCSVSSVIVNLVDIVPFMTPLEDFTSRLKVLKDLAAPVFARAKEHRERPEALENMEKSLNHSRTFLEASKEKTEKVKEEEGLFKEKELELLGKKIVEIEKWRDEKIVEQEALPLSEMPKLTVSMINSKIGDIESEVQFLVKKAKLKKAELERCILAGITFTFV